jgi:hypothetical protein
MDRSELYGGDEVKALAAWHPAFLAIPDLIETSNRPLFLQPPSMSFDRRSRPARPFCSQCGLMAYCSFVDAASNLTLASKSQSISLASAVQARNAPAPFYPGGRNLTYFFNYSIKPRLSHVKVM